MWAMIVKEFRQLRRDRRTLAMMIALPIILLVVLGYAASFDVTSVSVTVVGPQAASAARLLPRPVRRGAVRARRRVAAGPRTSCGTGTPTSRC